jgi:hypothetical protein
VLEEALIGAWSLCSYESRERHGQVGAPLGPRPRGTIIYTADGQVSAHVMADKRPPCTALLPFDCTPEEKIAAAESYFGYVGTYTVDGDCVTHHVLVSSFPNWTGADLGRTAELHGDSLTLRSDEQLVGGKPRVAVLTWRRVKAGTRRC